MKTKNIKTKIIGFALLASVLALSSKAQQSRNVGDFNGIKAGDTFTIIISQSEANTVQVDVDEKVLPQIKTEVKDGILSITADENIKSEKPQIINIGVKSLNSLEITGAAEVKSSNKLTCDKLTIESSGAGKIYLDIKANEVKTKITGAGNVALVGTSQILDVSLSGAGDLKASNMEAETVKVKVSGAGDAKVNVKQNLDADVSGAGSIIYKGNPIDRNINITGAGSVRESKSGNGEETAGDTTKLKLGKKKFVIIGDGKDDDDNKIVSKKDSLRNYNEGFKHWTGFEIGVNGLLDYKNSLDPPTGADFLELNYSKCIQFGLNLFEKDFHIYKNYVNLTTGFGFDFNHYALKNSVTLNSDALYLDASENDVKYNKNTLNVSYIKIPLMLEFNMGKKSDNNFHVSVGGEFEYRIHSVSKQKYDLNDKHYKMKQRDDYNLAPFLYSATARIGYNNVTVFANYSLNRLFKKDQGPQVYPFTAGVNFNF